MISKLDFYQKKHGLMSADEIRPGLEAMERALARLGNPERGLRCIHVAGTNGKGSTVAFMESVARAHGLSTGSFTSPAIKDLHDQIRLDGQPSGEEDMDLAFKELADAEISGWLTDFELLTTAAFLIFRNRMPDLVFVEAGMGGRYDSTNVIIPEAAVITSISLDHIGFLGKTLKEIAWHKAGILKRSMPGIIGPLPEEALREVIRVGEEAGAALSIYGEDFGPVKGVTLGLSGPHQEVNFSLALRALEATGISLKEDKIRSGAETVSLPGRFEEIIPGVYLDGAHNPAAAEALVHTVRERFGKGTKVHLMVGMLKTKDIKQVIRILEPIAARFTFIEFNHPDAAVVEELAACTKVESYRTNVGEIGKGSVHSPLIITGSLYLLSQLHSNFR